MPFFDRKSGIPHDTEIPAPANTTTCLAVASAATTCSRDENPASCSRGRRSAMGVIMNRTFFLEDIRGKAHFLFSLHNSRRYNPSRAARHERLSRAARHERSPDCLNENDGRDRPTKQALLWMKRAFSPPPPHHIKETDQYFFRTYSCENNTVITH